MLKGVILDERGVRIAGSDGHTYVMRRGGPAALIRQINAGFGYLFERNREESSVVYPMQGTPVSFTPGGLTRNGVRYADDVRLDADAARALHSN